MKKQHYSLGFFLFFICFTTGCNNQPPPETSKIIAPVIAPVIAPETRNPIALSYSIAQDVYEKPPDVIPLPEASYPSYKAYSDLPTEEIKDRATLFYVRRFVIAFMMFLIIIVLIIGGAGIILLPLIQEDRKKSNRHKTNRSIFLGAPSMKSYPRKINEGSPNIQASQQSIKLEEKMSQLLEQKIDFLEQKLQKVNKEITEIKKVIQQFQSGTYRTQMQPQPIGASAKPRASTQNQTDIISLYSEKFPSDSNQSIDNSSVLDLYQSLITAFNTQNSQFFEKDCWCWPLNPTQETLGNQLSEDSRIVEFEVVDNHRDAAFMAVKIGQKYFIVPDFISPYYPSLNWLEGNEDIFRYDGSGNSVKLIKPATAEYTDGKIWKLIESGECVLF